MPWDPFTSASPPPPPLSVIAVDATLRTYSAASQACEAAGGRLVSLHSQGLAIEVRAALRASGFSGSSVWIGGNDIAVEGQWVWADGTPFPAAGSGGYNVWAPNEPNNAGNSEDCLVFRYDNYWNDANCGRRYMSVCEGSTFPPSQPPPPPLPPHPPPPSPPPGTQLWRLDTSGSIWSMCFKSNGAFARPSCASNPLRGHTAIQVPDDDDDDGDPNVGHTLTIRDLYYEAYTPLVWDIDMGFVLGGLHLALEPITHIVSSSTPITTTGSAPVNGMENHTLGTLRFRVYGE